MDLVWYTERQDQGQMITVQSPQLPGAAEGTCGPAEGLTLSYDSSDGDWTLYADDGPRSMAAIARGNVYADEPTPTVAEAMEIRKMTAKA